MKTVVLCLLFAAGLAGCASAPSSGMRTEVDYARMALIERAAAREGVQVIWFNAPRKVVASGS
jgi:hypothetical protein